MKWNMKNYIEIMQEEDRYWIEDKIKNNYGDINIDASQMNECGI